MKEENNVLHKLAMRAKERLRRGNYAEQKIEPIKKPCALRLICGESIKAEIEITKIEKGIDAKLYKKVKKLIEGDDFSAMPLGKLIDNEIYKNLTEVQQERYLFDLSENYIKLKTFFENEKVKVG